MRVWLADSDCPSTAGSGGKSFASPGVAGVGAGSAACTGAAAFSGSETCDEVAVTSVSV